MAPITASPSSSSSSSSSPLQIDDRIGSKDLLPLLIRRGTPCALARLPFADVAFVGRGPEDRPWRVGIEIKTIPDLVSCIVTARFAGHQLPGLLATYDDVSLLVQGRWRARRDGLLEIDLSGRGHWGPLEHGRRRWMYRDVLAYLQTIAILGGVRIARTEDRDETATWIATTYRWWTGKRMEDHQALKAITDLPMLPDQRPTREQGYGTALLLPPSTTRRIYAQLPGVGYERSVAVEQAFPSVFDAVMAGERDWAQIPGIGKVLAKRIVEAIRGEEEGQAGKAGKAR